jgi:hypothetical protein
VPWTLVREGMPSSGEREMEGVGERDEASKLKKAEEGGGCSVDEEAWLWVRVEEEGEEGRAYLSHFRMGGMSGQIRCDAM